MIDSMRPPFPEQHKVSQEDLATIACYGNLKRLCSTCNKSITVKGIISRTMLPACEKIYLAVEQELAIAVWIKRQNFCLGLLLYMHQQTNFFIQGSITVFFLFLLRRCQVFISLSKRRLKYFFAKLFATLFTKLFSAQTIIHSCIYLGQMYICSKISFTV